MIRPCAIVLGAGYGRRFSEKAGQAADKLLATCTGLDGRRRPVLEHTLRAFEQWAGARVLVVRPDSPGLAEVLQLARQYGFETLPVASGGMGDSLSAAVRACTARDGWVVALGDMPWVRPDTLLQVAASITPDRVSVPTYQGTRGHPVGFGVAYGSGLSALQGDQGGRLLLREGRVTWLEVDDPGILRDVDVPHDLLDLSAPAVTGPL